MKHKILMTLALLITAATGAWADIAVGDVFKTGSTIDFGTTSVRYKSVSGNSDNFSVGIAGKVTLCYEEYSNGKHTFYFPLDQITVYMHIVSDNSAEPWGIEVSGGEGTQDNPFTFEVLFTEPPLKVKWDAATNTGTFDMPGSDVLLTPIYAEATVRDYYEETETAYASLKEAFANLKEGDVITLDWNVTLTEQLETPETEGGIDFTIDFNGYTIDGDYGIYLNNYGDRLTFTDSSDSQLGGYKAGDLLGAEGIIYAFDAGRFYVENNTAETLNAYCAAPDSPWEMRPGKEFIDLNDGDPDDDGFTVRVDYKAYELTIGAGKFDTFFDDYNVVLDAETPQGVGLYTISSIDTDRTEAVVVPVADPIAAAGTPMLVYNGTANTLTVKLKVTPEQPTNGQMHAGAFQGTAVDLVFTDADMAAYDYYTLSGGKLFVPVYDAGTLGAHQCWIEFDKAAGAPARLNIVFEESQATEVTEVIEVIEVNDDSWYDLNGIKLDGEPTVKGVYVKNGKKVVIR